MERQKNDNEFQPIPVFVKQSEIDQALNQWNERRNYFQSTVNKYKALNIEAPLLESDLVEMMDTPKELLVKKLTKGDGFSLGGLKLDAEKAFDLLEKPLGSIEFVESIENLKRTDSHQKWYYRHAYFFIIKDGLVEIKPEELEKIKTQNTVFLKSQKDKDIYDLLVSICDKMNSLNKLHRMDHFESRLFTDLISVNIYTGDVSINDNFLTIYNR